MGLVKKLFIKPGYRVTVVNAPESFALPVDELPENVEVIEGLADGLDFVLAFAKSKEDLQTYVPGILQHIKDGATLWLAYPKKTSKIKSDISRDYGWDVVNDAGFIGVSLISIDDTWSAMRFRKNA